MSYYKSRLVDIEDCFLAAETDKALLIRYEELEVWLPKSRCEFDGQGVDSFGTVTMDKELACEKGFIA